MKSSGINDGIKELVCFLTRISLKKYIKNKFSQCEASTVENNTAIIVLLTTSTVPLDCNAFL